MRTFCFRLQSVLQWRVLQLELEESRLQALFDERREIDGKLDEWRRARVEAEREVLGLASVEGDTLRALEQHRARVVRETERLGRRRADCEARIEAQRERVLKAERDLRLLERLRDRRLAEWRVTSDREQEALATESFLARWMR
jgi:flagellar export protein FliJ